MTDLQRRPTSVVMTKPVVETVPSHGSPLGQKTAEATQRFEPEHTTELNPIERAGGFTGVHDAPAFLETMTSAGGATCPGTLPTAMQNLSARQEIEAKLAPTYLGGTDADFHVEPPSVL